jgi:hypothetical protein
MTSPLKWEHRGGWNEASELATNFWALIDATEELFEASAEDLKGDVLLEVLNSIPPQRFAPIILHVVGNRFELRRRNRGPLTINVNSLRQAFNVVRREVVGTFDEIECTNCDRRFVTYLRTLVQAVDREFDSLSPIEAGINLIVVESTMKAVSGEVADVLYGKLVATTLNLRNFLSNFKDWREYSRSSLSMQVDGRMVSRASAIVSSLKNEAFDEEVEVAAKFYAEVSAHKDQNEAATSVRAGFVQSVMNIISAAAREAIKLVAITADKTLKVIMEHFGKSIGALAAGWLLSNLSALRDFAGSHVSLSWIKGVLDLLSKCFG